MQIDSPSFISLPDQIDFSIYAPGNDTIILRQQSKYPFSVIDATLSTLSGTCTATYRIDTTVITGLSGLSVTSAENTSLASANNSVLSGNTLDLVLTNVTNVTWLNSSIKIERNG